MMNLEDTRKLIDSIDDQIIHLLIQRYDLVQHVKSYKKKHQLPVLDQSREDLIYQKIDSKKYNNRIKEIYQLIMALSKDMQQS